ncbi:hypothetical protein OAB94_00940 [Flavobacteriaceae bacterium]|nr:hypothetical protein [Flavobacteriaceae bacterium]
MAMPNLTKIFGSAFEKIGSQSADVKSSAEANILVAASVSVGGQLYQKLDEIVNAIKELSGSAKKPDFKELAKASGGGFSMMDSLALALLAPTLRPIGKGLGFVIDAINNLEEGGEEKAKALESIFGALAKLGEVGKSIFVFAGWMALALPFLMITAMMSPVIAIALGATLMAVRLATRKLDEEQMEKIKMLGDVGKSILMFTVSLALASIIMPYALKGALGAAMLMIGMGMVFMLLDEMGISDNIEKTAKGLALAGLAILSLGVALALFTFLQPLALKGLAGAMLVLVGIAFAFKLISSDDDIEKGAKGLAFAGLAILSLGVSLALFQILNPSFATLGKVMVILGLLSVQFKIIGEGAQEIKDAAFALMFAGLSIVVVAISFRLMNYVLGDSMKDPANYAGLLLVGALAVGYKFIGEEATDIQKGAMAMIATGGSLIVIAIGMFIMSKALKDNGWELLGMTAALLVGLGLAMAAAGVGAAFIAPGAGAMAVAGVALITVGLGMMAMGAAYKSQAVKDLVKPDTDGNTPIKTLLTTVASGFNMWPWEVVGVMTGAGAMVVAGLALISIGAGLKSFASVAEKVKLPELADTVSYMIGVLSIPFNLIGGGGTLAVKNPLNGEEEEIKFAGGDFWSGGNPVKKGIDAVLNMGTALSNIAGGVQSMANLKFPTGFDKKGKPTAYETIGGDAFKKVIVNTQYLVGALAIPFAEIGMGVEVEMTNPITGSTYKIRMGGGNFFSDNVVKKGVDAVMDMGMALSNLAGGVQDMAMLKMPTGFDPKTGKATGYIKFNSDSARAVTENTQMLISALSGTFAELGKDPDAQGGSWWGGKSTIQKGIDLVAGFGTPLVNLAKGVQDMANLRFAKQWDKDGKATAWHDMKDIGTVSENVKTNTKSLINALTGVFSDIGSGEAQVGGWWSGYTNFDKGIEIVNVISEPYTKLGQAIKTISEAVMKQKNVNDVVSRIQSFIGIFTGTGENGDDAGLLNTKKLYVNAIGHSFEKLSSSIPAIISAIGSYDAEKGKTFASMLVGPVNAKDPVSGYNAQKLLWHAVGHSMVQTGDNMPKIAESINAIDLEKLVESRKMFEALGVLSNGGEPSDILAQMGDSLSEALQNLANMLQEFQGAVTSGNEGILDATGKMTAAAGSIQASGETNKPGVAQTPSPSDGTVVAAIKQLQNTLVSSGIKVNKSWFG